MKPTFFASLLKLILKVVGVAIFFVATKSSYAEDLKDYISVVDLIKQENYEKAHKELWSWPANSPGGLYLLGYLTANGFGTETDFKSAHFLFSKSLNLGFLESAFAICQLILSNPKSSEYNPQKAIECYEKNSEFNHKIAKEILAVLILRGEHSVLNNKYDLSYAQKLLEDAFASGEGSGSAAFLLLQFYDVEDGLNKNTFKLLESAATKPWMSHFYGGDNLQSEVSVAVARAYLKGDGVEKDLKKYFEFLSVAERKGDKKAVCLIGEALLVGVGVEKNLPKAEAYLKHAENQGCRKATLLLKRLNWEKQLNQVYEEFRYIPPPKRMNLVYAHKELAFTRSERSTKEAITHFGKNTSFGQPGSSYQSLGNITFGSDGTTYTKIGKTTIGSNGVNYNSVGNFTFGSDGTSYTSIGRLTFGSGGSMCRTYGHNTYC